MIKTNLKIITISLIALALFSTNVLAIPGMSHKFFGTVTINGQSAPDGTTVTAKIGGTTYNTTTSGGKFGYPLYSFGVPDPNQDRSGSEIRFFVNTVDTGLIATFCNGCFNLCGTNATGCSSLSLAVTVSTPQQSTPSGGGGGGGSGGGFTTPTTQTNTTTTSGTTTQTCQERWICTDWSSCQNGVQTRTCNDENNCGTDNNEPFTSQPCSAEEKEQAEQASALFPTGFFLGLSTTDWIIGAVVGIVVAAVLIFILSRRKTSKK